MMQTDQYPKDIAFKRSKWERCRECGTGPALALYLGAEVWKYRSVAVGRSC